MCSCDVGWHGDDCSHALMNTEKKALPILSAGHFNITNKKSLNIIRSRIKLLLVGYSSATCHKCIAAEIEYAEILNEFKQFGVALGRADADIMRSELEEIGATSLPALVLYRGNRAVPKLYDGPHLAKSILEYVRKISAVHDFEMIHSLSHAHDFLLNNSTERPSAWRAVLGVFRDEKIIENDEFIEFQNTARHYKSSRDVYWAAVIGNEALAAACIDAGLVDGSPGVTLSREEDIITNTTLKKARIDTIPSLTQWLDTASLPLLGQVTPNNFIRYEKTNKPMVLLFLDTRRAQTNGISNSALLEELRTVARDESFSERLVFGYLDGILYADRARALGIYGGKSKLPGLALNTKHSEIQAAFPESLPLTREAMRAFLSAFLAGTLRRQADADKLALTILKSQTSSEQQQKFTPARKPLQNPPIEQVGISEQFGPSSKGVQARGTPDQVVKLVYSNFSLALDETTDAMILIHATDCEPCAHLTVYYKKVAERFADLHLPHLLIARFDATLDTPPPPLTSALSQADLPLLVFLPANNKHPPLRFYSGLAKVQPIMRWVQDMAYFSFELPALPHLTPDERLLYKEQVTEREARRRKEELESENNMNNNYQEL